MNVPCISPLDQQTIASYAGQVGRVMTVEDHSIVGGLGSAVCETLCEHQPVPVLRIGLTEFGESGDPDALYAKHHLDAEGIYQEAQAFLTSTPPSKSTPSPVVS